MSQQNFVKMKCIPCRGGVPKMKKAEVKKAQRQTPGWKFIPGNVDKIQKEFKFKDFAQLMRFVNKVAKLAEKEGHHPDLYIYRWNHLRLDLYTHKINGLFRNDFIMAAKINRIK